MAVRLGELLIKKNLLTQAQLEEALQAQVIFGGQARAPYSSRWG